MFFYLITVRPCKSKQLELACLVVAPSGAETLAVDLGLDQNAYVGSGLGGAGDPMSGTIRSASFAPG